MCFTIKQATIPVPMFYRGTIGKCAHVKSNVYRRNIIHIIFRRRVSSVVEHSSANPKVPGSIPGPGSYRGHGL